MARGLHARRGILAALFVALGCGEHRPDVLLVTIDTLRADQLGSYGAALGASPNVDALAAEGVVFERAIAASPATVPSHASIMTSRWVRGHSIGPENGNTQLVGRTTLAEHFHAAGYRTGAFVGNVALRHQTRLDRGFDRYDDELPDQELNRPLVFERTGEKTTARALAWLEADRTRPFFLWVHYQDPHGPYTPPAAHLGRIRLPPRVGEMPLPVLTTNSGAGGIPAYQVLPGVVLPSQYLRRYAAELRFADAGIGQLLGAVGNAIVLLTADHGEALGEAARWFVHGHTTRPELAHVPLILRASRIAPGRRAETVSHVDVLPTLLDLADLDVPDDAQGVALGRHLRGGRPLPPRRVYCDRGWGMSAYSADGFITVSGTLRFWPRYRDVGASEPSWESHAWTGGRSTPRASPPTLDDDVAAYLSDVTPLVDAEAADSAHERRLEALGYVEPRDDR